MAQPSSQPRLTPQFCFSSGTVRDFLRASRSSIDDTINQNLNALNTPSRAGFDPASTSQRTPRTTNPSINTSVCTNFLDRVLFPSWEARSQVLNYCAAIASSPDPDDPDTALREIESQKNRERIVDERLDPYSGRFYPRESRTEALASLMRQEREVEHIVRHRTWEVIRDRCECQSPDWHLAMKTWAEK